MRVAVRASVLSLVFAAGVLAGCGGSDDSEPSEPTTAPAATVAATSAAASATRAPSPAAVSNVNVAELEGKLAQAYRDNRTFVPRASVDELKVTFDAATGIATFSIRPLPTSTNTIGGNSQFLGGPSNDALQITAQSALVANKVTWASFPEVKRVYTVVLTEFSTAAGTRNIDNAAGISVDRATGEKLDYDALKTSVPAQPRSFFCTADAYAFQAVVYNSITDKGCLTGVAKGRIP
jgi:hypothetical protein